MSVADRLVVGSLWVTLSRLIVNGLSTVSTIILAWYLLPSDFGLVALATTMLAVVTAVTEFSLNEALIRHEAPEESHFSAAWTLAATRGLIVCILFAAFAYPASLIYNEPRLFGLLLVLSLSPAISGLENPRKIMLQRELIFWQEFVLNVTQKVTGFVAGVGVAVIYHSYWALVVGTLVMQATSAATSYLVMPFRPRVTFSHAREFFSFSIWMTAASIINTLNWRFDYLLVGKMLGGSALGYYSLGGQLAMMPTREATAPLTVTIYPAFTNVRHDPPRLRAAYLRTQALLTAIALPAGIGMAVVADPLVRFMLGERWPPVIFIVQALASVFALQTLGSLNQPLGMALGQTRTLFIRDFQMLLVRIPVITIGVMFWGLPGLIFSRVLTGLFGAVVNMVIVKRFINVTVTAQLMANFRALTSSGVLAAGVSFAGHSMGMATSQGGLVLQLVVLASLGGILYCGSSFILWSIMGRPDGPETDARRLAFKVLAKKKRRLSGL
ncbi:lipopolysaccharide biosynthesis protein [Mesorhizobium sp. USDA-HM6]|nr:lipopolysaccharide biosynthesis protein [Mesorhizobium sp. USDA-HM6]